MNIERVAVLGAGVIGSGWTVLLLTTGYQVDVYEQAQRGKPRVRDYIAMV